MREIWNFKNIHPRINDEKFSIHECMWSQKFKPLYNIIMTLSWNGKEFILKSSFRLLFPSLDKDLSLCKWCKSILIKQKDWVKKHACKARMENTNSYIKTKHLILNECKYINWLTPINFLYIVSQAQNIKRIWGFLLFQLEIDLYPWREANNNWNLDLTINQIVVISIKNIYYKGKWGSCLKH